MVWRTAMALSTSDLQELKKPQPISDFFSIFHGCLKTAGPARGPEKAGK